MKRDRCRAELSAHLPARLAGLPKDTPVLLALSGGADSVVLLHLLSEAAARDGFRLLLAHVHHGIRGAEADRDRAFCASLAEKYGCEIFFLDADVPALAREHHRSLEEEGRTVRYAFFERLMREKSIPLLATAHHADDNLETLFLRLLRGTGGRGLAGIPPVRPLGDGFLTRPLLTVSKEEILTVCRTEDLEYVTDSTNTLPCCTRNRIRHTLLPALYALSPNASMAAVRAQNALREDNALLDALADELYAQARTPTGLRLESLRTVPAPLCKRALLRFFAEYSDAEPEALHLEEMLALVQHPRANASLSLPDALRLVTECNEARILPARSRERREAPLAPLPIPVECGEFPFFTPDGEKILVSVHVSHEKNKKVYNLSTTEDTNFKIPSAIIEEGGLLLRTRAPGERIRLGGMHRSLRRLYAARGIPARLRDCIPLLCDRDGVLWAPLLGARDGIPTADGDTIELSLTLPESFSARPTLQGTSDGGDPSPTSASIELQHPQTEEFHEKTQHCP